MRALSAWLRNQERRREVRRARKLCATAGHPIDHLTDEEIEERLALASIRENMRFFGYPVDDMTDEELRAGAQRAGEFVGASGVEADDLAKAFEGLG